jgi:hypothetical protein
VLGGWYHALETGGVATEAIVRAEGAGIIMEEEVGVAGGATQSVGACRALIWAGVARVVVQVGEWGNTGLTDLTYAVA